MQEALAFKKRFDPVLRRVLDKKIREVRRTTSDPFVLDVVKHGRRLLLAGGKRVRPFLAFLSYRAAGGKDPRVLDTLVGLELFHAFALVHDDIMDKGKTRHDVRTAHTVFGESQAILLGDLLFGWASEIIAPTKGQPVFAKMVQEVILGQMLDVDAVRRKRVSDRFVQDKMRLKTASYTFIRPMQFGAALAGRPDMFAFCEKFGLPLGLAFQIQDDLLDLTASSSKLGKTAMSDVREGQKTVLTQQVESHKYHRQMLEKMKGRTLSAGDRKKIRKMFWESGATQHGVKIMNKYFKQAEQVAKGKVPFLKLVEYIRSRTN